MGLPIKEATQSSALMQAFEHPSTTPAFILGRIYTTGTRLCDSSTGRGAGEW